MALKDLEVRLGLNSTDFNSGLKKAQSGLKNFNKSASDTGKSASSASSGLAALSKGAAVATAVVAGLAVAAKGAYSAFKQFVSLESSVTRASDIFGNSMKYITYYAENTAKAFGMSETAAYQYAATYGNLFRNITKDSAENAKVTIAMLKASAVIASKTGRTTEDVMERIRSGLLGNTEAIEDLGIYAQVGAIEATDAFKKIANGRSWEQLTYYEQQQIRTLSILEQAHTQFGDTVQNGSAFSLQTLSGAFKNLISYAGAFVNAGLQPVIAGLTKLCYWATAGLKSLAALFGLKVNVDSAKGTEAQVGAQNDLTEAVDKTTKAKQKLAGFDQINTLSSDTGASGSGGSAVGGAAGVFDSIADPEFIDDSKMEQKIEELKGKLNKLKTDIKDSDIFKGISDSWNKYSPSIEEKFSTFKNNIGNLYKNFYKTTFKPITDNIGNDLSWLWKGHMSPLWSNISGFFGALIEMLLTFYNKILYPIASQIWGLIGPKIANTITFISDIVSSFYAKICDIFSGLFKSLEGLCNFLTGVFTSDWQKAWDGLAQIVEGWKMCIKGVADFVENVFTDCINYIIRALNRINFKVPDWMKDIPLIGKYAGKTIGFNVKELSKGGSSDHSGPSGSNHGGGGGHYAQFATGGVVSSPTYALIGEAGSEAVMPLERNTGWIDRLADKLNSKGGAGGDIYLTENVYLDDGTLIDTFTKKINRNSRRNNKPILGV